MLADVNDDGEPETLNGQRVYDSFAKIVNENGNLKPGDHIFLKRGDVFLGSPLVLTASGTAEQPITLASYGDPDLPPPELRYHATREQVSRTDVCLTLQNASHWRIYDIAFRNAFGGLYLRYDGWTHEAFGNRDVTVENCTFTDINTSLPEEWSNGWKSNFEFAQPAGIMVGGRHWVGQEKAVLDGLTISGCRFDNVGAGICLSYWNLDPAAYTPRFRNVAIRDCVFDGSTKPAGSQVIGAYLTYVDGGSLTNCRVTRAGGLASSGTTGLFLEQVANFIIADSVFEFTERAPPTRVGKALVYTWDGCGVDFEGQCTDIVFARNVVRSNDGYGVLIMPSKDGSKQTIAFVDCLFADNARNSDTVDRLKGLGKAAFTAYQVQMDGPWATGTMTDCTYEPSTRQYNGRPVADFSPAFLAAGFLARGEFAP